MHFVLRCIDRTDAPGLRQEVRPRHLDWVTALGARVVVAGPLLDEDGVPKGSLFVLEGESAAEIAALAATDPYVHAGLFAETEITPFRVVFNHPVER